MRSLLSFLSTGVTLAAFLGCDGPTKPANPVCESSTAIVIGPSSPHAIGWSPTCRVAGIAVEDAINGATNWMVYTPRGEITFVGPATIGTLPAGLNELIASSALTSGRLYRIRLLGEWQYGHFLDLASKAFTEP